MCLPLLSADQHHPFFHGKRHRFLDRGGGISRIPTKLWGLAGAQLGPSAQALPSPLKPHARVSTGAQGPLEGSPRLPHGAAPRRSPTAQPHASRGPKPGLPAGGALCLHHQPRAVPGSDGAVRGHFGLRGGGTQVDQPPPLPPPRKAARLLGPGLCRHLVSTQDRDFPPTLACIIRYIHRWFLSCCEHP